MIVYETIVFNGTPSIEIKIVEVDKKTKKSVWIEGRKIHRLNVFWDTWKEAHRYILDLVIDKIGSLENELFENEFLMIEIEKLKN